MTNHKADPQADSNCPKNVHALKVSELHHTISRIMMFVAFEATALGEDPGYQQLIFTKDSEAIFNLECPHIDCVNGGFDFSPFIRELIENKETSAQGIVPCQGWHGSGQSNRLLCSLKAEYRIMVDYD